jgi:periplasmic protein TonB
MSGIADRGQYASDATALAVAATAVVLALLTSPALLRAVQLAQHGRTEAIELTLQSAPEETPPAPPAPPPPRPIPKRRVERVPAPATVAPEPIAAPSEVAPPEAALVSAPAPAPTGSPQTHPDLDAQYAALLLTDIDRRTHAPDSVEYRLRHPSGEVRVSFVLARSGEVHEAKLLRSSGSSLLDEAALAIVSSGHYPPMPAQAFAGESRHTFVVTIEFRRANA